MSDRESSLHLVGVLGAGTMGRGIAQASVIAGYQVILHDISEQALQSALDSIAASLQRGVGRGRLSPEQASAALQRIATATTVAVPAQADLVIEAAPESLALKQSIFQELEKLAPPHTILASNTSSLSINALAGATNSPERIVGLHFFNPAHVMRLVEVIAGDGTSDETIRLVSGFVRRLGKEPVYCGDTPAFLVNRVARPFYGEALRLLGEGGSDVATIDELVESLGFRMGPFRLIDLVGCDVSLAVTESVYEAYYQDPKYRPHPIQRRMVQSGRLGRKTAQGFYDYAESDADGR